MNILGIDYGKKRIGLAWVDTELGVVLPYGVIQNSKLKMQNTELIEFVEKESVDKIVIGLPIGLDGKENENTENIRKFAENLKQQVGLPIEFVDERFTSKQADAMGGTVSRDEKAAMVILSSYLEANK